jgi:hypothetical protein
MVRDYPDSRPSFSNIPRTPRTNQEKQNNFEHMKLNFKLRPMKDKLSWMQPSFARMAVFTIMLALSSVANAASIFVFSNPGNSTWTCPAGVTSVQVECWGGGGGGGGVGAIDAEAGGGAGGSYVSYTVNVTPNVTYKLTVGTGGTSGQTTAGNVNGGTGGSSYFGNTTTGSSSGASVLATGGTGGNGTTTAGTSGNRTGGITGGTGSTSGNVPSSGATANIAGGNGGTSVGGASASATSGAGGAGASGGAGGLTAASGNNPGNPGTAPGGGGSGASSGGSVLNIGGAGGAGMVRITPTSATTVAFTPGNIVVFRAGDGITAPVNTGNPVFLDEYTTSGTYVQSVVMPTSLSGSQYPLITSGTATSEGGLTRSTDGRYIIAAGYGTNTGGGTSISGTTSASVPRVIGRVDSFGHIDTSTALTDWGTAQNPRCAISTDGTVFWGASGANVNYATFTHTTSTALASQNSRGISIYNSQLYVSSQSGGILVSTVGTGLPTTTSQAVANISGITGSFTPNGFVFVTLNGGSAPDTLYVTDDTAGAIEKWCLVGGTWTLKGSITTSAVRWLTATVSGSTVTLYATTGGSNASGGGSVYKVTDTSGYNAAPSSTTVSTIASAFGNSAFRGIALAPVAYTVTYSGNNNTGGSVPTDSTAYANGATVTVMGNTSNLTQTGYAFTGWNTAANGSGTSYAANATFTISANTTLYAQWSLTYSVTYNGNGNTGGNPPTDNNSYVNGATVTVLGNAGNLTQIGYGFAGWNTAADGSGTSYAATGSATFAMGSANVILYAQWTQTPSITTSGGPLNFGPVAVNGTSASQSYNVSGANLTDPNGITINAPANFQVSTDNSTFSSQVTLPQSGNTVSSMPIYVRFQPTQLQNYSDNITNTSSGASQQDVAVSGTGASAPSVTTQAANPATNSATLNGTVTTDNGAAITDRGFYWSASPGVTTSDNQLDEGGTTTGTFSKAITSGMLSPNTIYYYRAYAVNSIGATLDSSGDTSFYTLPNTPTAPTVGSPTTTSLNVTIGSGDGNPPATTYAIQETSTLKYVQADGTLAAAPVVYQTASTWGTVTVSGLTNGANYTFQVAATNGAGIQTAFGPTATASTTALPFTSGNLVVYRIGDGVASEVSSGNPVFLDEYTTSGTLVQSVAMPITQTGSQYPLIASGTATSEGQLNRSVDGRYLLVPGYGTNTGWGSSSISGTASTSVPRVMGRVDGSGNIDTSTALTDWGTAQNPRSIASTDGTVFWGASGANVVYATLGSSTSTSLTNKNSRGIAIYNNQLYISSQSGSTLVATVGTGVPTTGGQTVANIPGISGSFTPNGFVFVTLNGGTDPDTLYVTDDTGGAIEKWCLVSGSWTLAGSITAAGVREIMASVGGSTVTLYATTGGNSAAGGGSIYTVTDTAGFNVPPSSTSVTTIATATGNSAFRGIAFTPKGSQTISPIVATTTNTYGDSSYSVATTASSGLTVTYSSDNTSVATVDASGTVTIVGAGTADILVNQGGNDFYNAAPQVSQTLTVNPLPVVLTGSQNYDGTASAPASILAVGNNLDGANLTLLGSAVLAGNNAGLQAIVDLSGLTLGGSAAGNYTLTGASGSVTIISAPLSITANPVSKTYGTALTLDPTAFTVGPGLVSPETVTAVTMTASGGTAATDAVSSSPYTITPSAATGTNGFLAANYNISYIGNSLTVSPLPVVLTGTRPYDGTAAAAFGILSVANKIGSDEVYVASGSATQSSASVGTNVITSFASLTLGGTTASNYTLAGASGAVVVTNPHEPFSIATPYIDNTGTNLVLIWNSIPGLTYQVRGSTDLNIWTNVGDPINATDTQTTNTVPIYSFPAQSFFDIFVD